MKRHWKQFSALFMAIILASGAAGCGNSKVSPSTTQADDATQAAEAMTSVENSSERQKAEGSSEAQTTGGSSEAQEAGGSSETQETEDASNSQSEQQRAEKIPAVTTITYFADEADIRIDGFYVLSEGTDLFAEALHAHNAKMKEKSDSCLEELQEDDSYSYECTAEIARCDDTVFSARQDLYIYLGQSDAETVTTGYNCDIVSGEELSLSDVITDMESFSSKVLEKMKAHPDQEWFCTDWDKQVTAALTSDDLSGWYLDDDAINIVFHAGMPEYTSEVEVEIPYTECAGILNERYANTSERICHKLDDYGIYDSALQYTFDADGDGQEELLTIDANYETNDYGYIEYVTPIISFGRDQDSLITIYGEEAEEGIGNSWVIQSEDGEYYLYMDLIQSNDYHSLMIYNLSEPDVGPLDFGENLTGSFADFAPANGENLYVENRIQLMGTYNGYTACHIGEGGQLLAETEEPEYYIINIDRDAAFDADAPYGQPVFALTLQQDMTEYVYDISTGEGSETTLAKGTVLYPYMCGADSYMIFKISDKEYVTLYYDDMSKDDWERKIEGIPEEELLDGMVYAG